MQMHSGKGFLCPGAHFFRLVAHFVISVPCCVFYIIECLVGTLAVFHIPENACGGSA